MHVLIAALPEYRWTIWQREQTSAPWSVLIAKTNQLPTAVDKALDIVLAPNVVADFTFSTRPVEAVSADLIETPEQLATGAIGCTVEAVCREGRFEGADDRWARVRRQHGRREVVSFGLNDVFRPQTLKAEITGWFESWGWHTFLPPRPHRNENVAPPHGREILLRRGDEWRARRICPSNFPEFYPGVLRPTQRPTA